jgi:hypothetical protein
VYAVVWQVDNLKHVDFDVDKVNSTLAKLSSAENPMWGAGHDKFFIAEIALSIEGLLI